MPFVATWMELEIIILRPGPAGSSVPGTEPGRHARVREAQFLEVEAGAPLPRSPTHTPGTRH